MPTVAHTEKHFAASASVRDAVIGMADGLTVPFALAAGLSGAVTSTDLVVVAGLAEIAAGAIAMGLGGYLAARTDAEHYASERRREVREVEQVARQERSEVADIFREYGLEGAALDQVVTALTSDKKRWVDFMMRYELNLEQPEPGRALKSAITIATAYAVGGLVPLASYFVLQDTREALAASVPLTAAALLAFGWAKARFTRTPPLKGALQTLLVGGLAAAAAFAIANAIA